MKENAEVERKGGYAAAMRAKQAAAAGDDGTPLPRVAALPSQSRLASHPVRGPLLSSLSDRALSNYKARTTRSQQTAASQRVGCRPATHSQQLAPMADAAARAPAGTVASRASRPPSVSSSIVIGDPGLDAAEQALQAELAATDRQLERLLRQSQQRRVPTPEPTPPAATRAAAVPAVVLGVPAAALPSAASVLQSAAHQTFPEPQAQAPMAAPVAEPALEQQQEQLQQPAISPQDLSIVRSVVTATGTGCKDIVASHTGTVLPPGACWTSRGHRTLRLESSAILQLWGRTNADVTLRITFADAASVPRIVRLEHAPTPTAAFERLGDIRLQTKSLTQLKHLFRLGKNLEVQRCLRIMLLGHMAEEDSGAHRVTHMLLTSSQGPQRSGSALSQVTFAAPDPLSARSAHASVNHAPAQQSRLDWVTPRDKATPDSGAALPPPLSAHSVASAPAAAAQAPAALATEAQLQSSLGGLPWASSGSQPRVPPLLLASILSGNSSTSESRGTAPPAQPAGQAATATEDDLSAMQPASSAAESPGAPATDSAAGLPAQQAQSIRAELDFLLLAEEFAAASQAQQEVEEQVEAQPTEAGVLAAAAAPAGQAADPLDASAAAALMLLPVQRCNAVAATLSKLQLSPEQATRAMLQLLDFCGSAADEHADDLLACLPSLEERAVLAGFDGALSALSSSEQWMLEMMAVPALDTRVGAWRFAARFADRCYALGAVAALLGAACLEVQQSELLRTLLKVAYHAGSFLNAGNKDGAASGFQVDALLRLKDVRSTRARSRTLLHFVAREVARQHPDGASLASELPSATAAAQLDLGAAAAELEELAAEAREAQAALAAGGDACTAPLAALQMAVSERLAALQAQMDDAQAAFRQLGAIINGHRATLAEPAVFFGILTTFADELDAAHGKNAEADAAAEAASSARKSQRTSADGSPTASTAISEVSRRSSRRSHTPANVRGSVASARSVGQASSLQRLKLVAEQRRSTAGAAPAASSPSHQPRHSPQPCMSQAAVESLGGSRRSAAPAGSPPPASSAVAVATLLGAGAAGGGWQGTPQAPQAPREQEAQVQQAGSKSLSTPVEELLRESARIISSIDLGDRDGGGFGSAIIASEAAAASSGAAGDTAGTPDGAVVSVAADSDAGFTTPRHEFGRAQPSSPSAATLLGAVPLRYAGGASAEDEVPAAAGAEAAAAAPSSNRGAAATHQNALNVSQIRQRSLQHLSPTSTPLSSLGRQSSRSSVVSSDAGGSTPASGKHSRVSVLRHSASPLGAPQQAQQAGHPAAAGDDSAAAADRSAAASHVLRFPDLPAGRAASPVAAAPAARVEHQVQLRVSYNAGPAADMYAYSSDEEGSPTAAASRAAAAEAEAAEMLAAARPPSGFGTLHSRASSCDLTFYAPFTLHQMGGVEEGEQQGLTGSLEAIVSAGSGSAWAPLAATHQRCLSASASGLRHTVSDAAAVAGVVQAAPRRAAVSMPASPTGGAHTRPPQPLNLRSVAGRLQLHHHAVERQPMPQLSPVLEALLDSIPSPCAAPTASAPRRQGQGQREQQGEAAATPLPAELTADDLVDLGNWTSDHEVEWAVLEDLEAAEREQRQAAEGERGKLAMLPPVAAHGAPRELTPKWAYPREQMHEWLAAQQAAATASAEQGQQQPLQEAPPSLLVQVAEGAPGGAAAVQPFQQLPPLPSPITTATVNLDATLARLLASAGNTPSGPLAKAAGRWRTAGEEAQQAGPQLHGHEGDALFLLEPLLPAPLGEGVRASGRMADGIPPAALRSSIDCLRASVRAGGAAGLQRTGSAPPTSLSTEAAAWAAQQAALYCQASMDPEGVAACGGEWADGGVGPTRRRDHLRGLRKLLSRGRLH